MKKNKNFVVRNLFWPGLFVLALLVAALGSNLALFRNRVQGTETSIFPNPAPPIQMSAGAATPIQTPAQPSLQVGAGAGMQQDVDRILARVLPAVVSVSRPGGGAPRQNVGGVSFLSPVATQAEVTGAGVIVDDRGYVLTTFQTVGSANLVKVLLYQGQQSGQPLGQQRELMADVIGVDPKCDMALLKIRAAKSFPAVRLGNSDQVQVGDIVFAIGNPFGFKGTVTMGIVSSSNRKVTVGGIKYPDLIQTDAAINDGNDGGPLVNVNGEVIGVNMACVMPDHRYSGIGFAVPINDAAGLLSGQAGAAPVK